MVEPDWEAIRQAYEAGMPNRKISDQYGVPESTLRKYAKREGWEKPSKSSKKSVRKSRAQSVRKTPDEHVCAHPDIPAVMEAAHDIETAYGLTPRAASFVIEYLVDRNATQAAIRAGYSEKSAQQQGSRLLLNAMVKKAINEQTQAQTVRTLITKDWLIGQLATIATADVSELMQLRKGCCRHCHGFDHGYQYIDEQEHQAVEQHAEAKGIEPPAFGGYGYVQHAEANPDCPVCGGEGVPRVHMTDTRQLSPAARLLFNGVEMTKNGIKVSVRDRDAALDKIARCLSAYQDRLDHTSSDGSMTPTGLEHFYGGQANSEPGAS